MTIEPVQLRDMMPFAAKLGIEVELASPERVTGRLNWAPDLCTVGGALHGGVLMALADSLGGICAYLNLPEGATTATISSATNMLRPVRDGHVSAETTVLHSGRSVIVVQTTLRDADRRLAAQVTQTQAVLNTSEVGPSRIAARPA